MKYLYKTAAGVFKTFDPDAARRDGYPTDLATAQNITTGETRPYIVRMEVGTVQLRLDEEWKRQMPRRQSGIVTLLTRPLLRRYGYRP